MSHDLQFISRLKEAKFFIIFILIVFALFFFFYRMTFNIGMIAGPNTFIPSLDSKSELEQVLSLWNYHALGSPSPKDGFAYYALSAPLLLILCNNSVLVEKIFLLVPMPLMAITMYIFLSYMLKSQYWKFVIALVYSINFITINQFLQQTEWILIAGVLFPLVLLYSFKFVRSPNICYLLILSSLVAIGTAFRIQVFIWFMLFIVVISITNVIEKKSLKYGLKMVLRLALLVGIVFVVTPIVLIPIISLAQGQTETALSGLAAQSIGYRVKSFYLTFAQTSALVFICGSVCCPCLSYCVYA